ncbi:MAG: mannitol dehydrogenase family protein, partial [Lachnospiraceae bacterium]|nr:mannitol dehydrogenase family protein [Lachnospiraceae bacterium]
MKLTQEGLKDAAAWEAKGYAIPQYDRKAVAEKTKNTPKWIHFGAGNIFRAFLSKVMQDLLDQKLCDTGIIVAEGFDYEIIQKAYQPFDNYSILATLKADGAIEKTVIGSVTESIILDHDQKEQFDRAKEIFRAPSLQMASFTITEKGYSLTNAGGQTLPDLAEDFVNGPGEAKSYLGKIAALLYERFLCQELPIAMVSMDNCSKNGEKLQRAIQGVATQWVSHGLVSDQFLAYINDPNKVSFPFTMIDKITPRPDAKVMAHLKDDQIEGTEPVITSKNTYIACFVNAEESQYLVVEDLFPNGKLPLENAGIIYTNQEMVSKVERMKVCTCLNPLHTALAVYGCLLGYELICEEMQEPHLRRMVERIGYQEGLPVVTDPGIIKPSDFLNEVLTVRIPNPFMPDSPQRIATDTSQKLSIRFGETIKAYQASEELNVSDLKMIPLVFAGWLRYLLCIDDQGNAFTPSSDPMLETLLPIMSQIRIGEMGSTEETTQILTPILQNEKIFGVDLCEAGLAPLVIAYFEKMA